MENVGSLYKTHNFGNLIIIKYVSSREVYAKFVDSGYEIKTTMQHIRKGNNIDRFQPTLLGVGIVGNSSTIDFFGKRLKEYQVWKGVLERCFSEKYRDKKPTYKDCTVSDNFKYFPYFKEWCNKQIGFDQVGWHLDKDILSKGNKVYSEDTCCFVPQEVNSLLVNRKGGRGNTLIGVSYHKRSKKFVVKLSTGKGVQSNLGSFDTEVEAFKVYKQAKEKHIKEVANKWKGQIDGRVYEALIKYEVEIND